MKHQINWVKVQSQFYSSLSSLEKYLPSNIYRHVLSFKSDDSFSMTIDYRLKAESSSGGIAKPLKEYDFDRRVAQLFFKKEPEDLSNDELEVYNRITDNSIVLIHHFYTFIFFPYKNLLFDNFSNDETFTNLQKVDYQIEKVNELIVLQKIINNPGFAKIEFVANENFIGKDNILSYKFIEQNFLSIEILKKAFDEKFISWQSKTTELLIPTSDGYALGTLDNIYQDEDRLLADDYGFSRSVLRYASQHLGVPVEPNLQSLEAIRKLLIVFKGKDNRKNKFYDALGDLVRTLDRYLLDEWNSLKPTHSHKDKPRLELILNFILLFDIIPENHRIVELFENDKSRNIMRDFVRTDR